MNARSWMAGVVAASAVAIEACAQDAVQWRFEDGGNGHWYQASLVNDWFTASQLASQLGTYLVTINSPEENQFVQSMLATTTAFRGYIGLEQLPGQAAPNTGWRWVNNEPLLFSNWTDFGGSFAFVAPDDTPCNQPPIYVEDGQADIAMIALDGKWDDLERGQLPCNVPWVHAAILEWSADCNSDGIVDFGQIRAGELDDANANNIPDCCEQGAACPPNLIVNGGFEIGPSQQDCAWVLYTNGSSFIPGWSVIASEVDRQRISNGCPFGVESWRSFEGEFTIDLDGWSHGGAIAQTVQTTVGVRYRLTFQLTGNCVPGTKSVRVEVGGTTTQFDHVCAATNPQPWRECSVEFTATSAITTLVLRSLSTSGQHGPVVDAVALVSLPNSCPADLDGNGSVNGIDLAIILNKWGTDGGKDYPNADQNKDGTVNAADLAAVLNGWGPCS